MVARRSTTLLRRACTSEELPGVRAPGAAAAAPLARSDLDLG